MGMNPRQFYSGRAVGIVVVLIIVGLVVLFFSMNSYIYEEKQGDGLPDDFKEVTFTLEGEPVTLLTGVGMLPIAGEAAVRTVRYFGNEFAHDIDGDGDTDMVFLVTADAGGSGTFYYVVGAVQEVDGYRGTAAMFLGDRIAPQSTSAGVGSVVVVNYADRAPGEPMTTAPSEGKSMQLRYNAESNDFSFANGAG
jgi:hypothetical protein